MFRFFLSKSAKTAEVGIPTKHKPDNQIAKNLGVRPIRAVSSMATFAIAIAAMGLQASAATAATTQDLLVDGVPLGGSMQPDGEFTVEAKAPEGVTVRFKIDGVYVGLDNTAPYALPVTTKPGNHRLHARWDSDGRQEIEVPFTVFSPSSPSTDVAEPVTSPSPTVDSEPVADLASTSEGADENVIEVSNASELSTALMAAKPGQIINLRDGSYLGKFVAPTSGTASAPITLRGSRNAVISTGRVDSGYGLHIKGSYWRITGLSVTNSAKGIVLDRSTRTVISGVDVGNIGEEGVHFRTNSADSVIENSVIHDVGVAKPEYGEGVYVGTAKSNWSSVMGSSATPDRSDRVVIRNNRISNTSAEGIDVKEGTTNGRITGNVFTNAGTSGANSADSWVDIKGNGYRVEYNSGTNTKLDAFQVHVALTGWGTGNYFSANTVSGGVPGHEVWVQSAALGTIVVCKASGAASGLSNIPCF